MTTSIKGFISWLPILAALAFVFDSCGAVKPYYSNEAAAKSNLETQVPSNVAHEIFLIGDAGEPNKGSQTPVLKLLEGHLEKAGNNSSVIFLGDNIYPAGLPESDEDSDNQEERLEMEAKINASLDILKDFKGNPYFIPGNHDWNNSRSGGLERIVEQAKYVQHYLDRKKVFYPKDGCSGPEVIEVNENLILLLIDSQWWLHDWSKEPGINEDCEIVTRDQFQVAMEDVIKKNKDKNILIAMHHPLYTQGPHGGYFTLSQHLFPLRDINNSLFVPLPVLGSLYPLYRASGGPEQDLAHPKYQNLKKALTGAASVSERVIFAAGHEHSLQYYDQGGSKFLVSGSGCHINPLRKGKKLEFGLMETGFHKLSYLENGEVWLEIWIPQGDGTEGKVVFRKKIEEAISKPVQAEMVFNLPETKTVRKNASDYYEAKWFRKFLLGKHYREAWSQEIEVPVMDITKEMGGLKPIQKGGGLQTKSLRLEAKNEKQYVIRSINKDVDKVVPKFLDDTFAEDVMQDQISTDHPYAAIVVPMLAEATGVYHANPRIVYVPKQEALKDYVEDFGDELYLFEERPEGKTWKDADNFGNPDDVVSFNKVLDNLYEDRDHSIDQKQVVRSRLFDMLINDWDRHDDQWRWGEVKKGDDIIYHPIPRDRDQAFHHKRSGVLPRLSQISWGLRKFQSFEPGIRSMKGMNFNGRHFDRSFMQELSWADWKSIAEDMQVRLSDEIIDQAFLEWQPELYAIDGARLANILKARRDNLLDFAKRQYRILAREVDVVGTDEDDFFDIKRLNNKETSIKVYQRSGKGKKKGKPFYERTFTKSETKEVRIYGLKGNDEFKISGDVSTGILIRIMGGKGKDKYDNSSQVAKVGKITRIYDKRDKSKLDGEEDFRFVNTDSRPELTVYDRTEFNYNFNLPLIEFAINVDDGLLLGGGVTFVQFGFKKSPYAASHTIAGKASYATGSFSFRYLGEIVDAIGKVDLNLEAWVNAPNFSLNFFGLGNESPDPVSEEAEFNRVRMDQVILKFALKKDFSLNHYFNFGPSYTYTKVSSNMERFVNEENPLFDSGDFDPKHFAGLELGYHFNNLNNPAFPNRGIRFNAKAGVHQNIEDSDMRFAKLESDFSIFYTLNPIQTTIAARFGVAHNAGEFEFFQANRIGGNTNLRGHRADRYYGQTAFYQNTELRIKLTKISNYILSSSIGISGHADHARVWVKDDQSDTWHYGYGGGIWLSIFDLGLISTSYTFSDTGNLFALGVGFFF